MSQEKVIALLGEPLIQWSPYRHIEEKAHITALQYSNSPRNTHYRLRQIYVENGIVTEVIGYFYVD